jgi:hypothetical protein
MSHHWCVTKHKCSFSFVDRLLGGQKPLLKVVFLKVDKEVMKERLQNFLEANLGSDNPVITELCIMCHGFLCQLRSDVRSKAAQGTTPGWITPFCLIQSLEDRGLRAFTAGIKEKDTEMRIARQTAARNRLRESPYVSRNLHLEFAEDLIKGCGKTSEELFNELATSYRKKK